MTVDAAGVIPAAGTVPWRLRDGGLEVLLVHRPRYDDWSWPKGKLDEGEDWAAAAARETLEETGLAVALGPILPPAEYVVLDRWGRPGRKLVHYWAARVTGGTGRLENEIDAVEWLSPTEANKRLDYARDREQLLAVVRLHQEGALDTWPLAVVRHAKAVPRSAWSKDDRRRPLEPPGHARAGEIVPILRAYGVRRVESSSSTRCAQTLAPTAEALGRPLRLRDELSEEAYAADPGPARARFDRYLRLGRPLAVCTHGPLLPDLLGRLVARVAEGADGVRVAELRAAAVDGLDKGDVLVLHCTGDRSEATVVAAEWHHTPSS